MIFHARIGNADKKPPFFVGIRKLPFRGVENGVFDAGFFSRVEHREHKDGDESVLTTDHTDLHGYERWDFSLLYFFGDGGESVLG